MLSAVQTTYGTNRPPAAGWARVRTQLAPFLAAAEDPPLLTRLLDLLAALFDPGLEPEALPGLVCPFLYLLATESRQCGASKGEVIRLATFTRQLLGQLVPQGSAPARISREANSRRTPLAYLQHWIWQHARAQRDPLGITYAARFHRALRALERGMLTRAEEFGPKVDRNLAEYASSARIFLQFAPPRERRASLPITALCAHALDRYRTYCQERTGAGLSPATQAKHAQHLRVLLTSPSRHQIVPHAHAAPRQSGDKAGLRSVVIYRFPRTGDEAALPGQDSLAVVRTPSPEAQRHGESALDYAQLLHTDPQQAPLSNTESRHWRRGWQARRQIMADLGCPADPSTIQPFELLPLYTALAQALERDETEHLGELFAGLLLYLYGIVPDQLLDLQLTAGPPSGEAVGWHLDPATWTLYHPFPALGYVDADPASFGPCRPGGRWVILPLVQWARCLGARYRTALEGAGLWPPTPFFLSLSPDRPCPMTVRLLDQCLAHSSPHGRLTVVRLAQSIRRWGAYAGLQRVEGALTSGRCGFAVHATCAYLNLSAFRLATRLATAAAWLHRYVLAEAQAQGMRWRVLEDPALWVVPGENDGARYGSLVVPTVGPLQDQIATLRQAFSPVSRRTPRPELRRAFNHYMLYEWLRLLWATAIRPVRDRLISRASFRVTPPWVLVADKDSPQWTESRLVPLLPESVGLLQRLEVMGREVRTACRGWRGFDESLHQPDRLFYWIDPQLRVRPLGVAAAEAILQEEHLAWPYPFNAGRHYFLTRAWEEGLLDQLDPFVGHLHAGREPWGRYAWAALEPHARLFRTHSRQILEEVGFADPGPFFS